MNDAWRKGYTSYDFGEVPGGREQLTRYKEKWGSAAVQLYHYDYPERVDSRGDYYFTCLGNTARAAWRRLPLKTTAAIGDWIYSYL